MNRILATLLCAFAFICAQAQDQRERLNFDQGWQFAFGDVTSSASMHNEGPYAPKFDASGWTMVDLPHDWVVDLPYAAEASHSHGYKTAGFKYPQTSVGWYRKTFTVPAEDYGKHIWLQFDGIFRDARIWVNGFYLGHEPNGYATQTYDISEYLNYGGENLVCVRADATLEERWFYEGAGIYRHVWLNKASKLHVAPFGTFVRTQFAGEMLEDGGFDTDLSDARIGIETTVKYMDVPEMEYNYKLSDRIKLSLKVDTNLFHVGKIPGELYVAEYSQYVIDENGQYVMEEIIAEDGSVYYVPLLETVPAHTEKVTDSLKHATWQSFSLHVGFKYSF